MEKRNIAIIAHVDHGKTTLVDGILKSSGMFRENEDTTSMSMDSNDIERERGITILAKTTAVDYKGVRINILDTPGHADFGGEVERIMHMVDGVLLVVDAYEGAMPQTRFVLKKAFEAGVKPIVVINKVDKPTARLSGVLDEVLDLFIELGADDEQLDFKVIYASAINHTSSLDADISTQKEGFEPILNTILEEIPSPAGSPNEPLQFQPALLDYNDFVGRIGIGRLKVGQNVSCCRLDGSIKQFRIQKLFGYYGYKRIEIEEAEAGDFIAIAGLADISVGETICEVGKEKALPILHIDEPTLQMTFGSNSSPFAGREGKILTSRKIGERLFREMQKDVSLKVEQATNESYLVSGRGELHLGILLENMRREGFELEVSKPRVIIKEIDGQKCEPYEELQIEVPQESVGAVIEELGTRGGHMDSMTNFENQVRYIGDRSNANKDSRLVSTKRSLIYGEYSTKRYEEFFLTPEERQATKDGYIYIHDKDSRMDTINCCLFDAKNVMTGGFTMGNMFYNEPNSLDTAFDVLGDIILATASQQYGKNSAVIKLI